MSGRVRALPGLCGSLVVVLFALGLAASAASASARLDPSFGDGGSSYHLDDNLSPAFGVAEGPSGRLVVVGSVPGRSTYLMRLLPDGTLDSSFGNMGGVAYYANKLPDSEELAIDNRGRILTVGRLGFSQETDPRGSCATVTRWPADGSKPAYKTFHFGQSPYPGTAKVCEFKNHLAHSGLVGRNIALTKSGKVLVGGTFYASLARQGGLFARLMPNGKLDKSLVGDRRTHTIRKGVAKILAGAHREFGSIRDIKPLAGGKVLVGGFLRGDFMAARFEADGGLDRSFGRYGVAKFDLDGDPGCQCSYGLAMVRDYHGRVLISGFTDPGGDGQARRLVVMRLLPDGRLDRSFGKNGVARLAGSIDAIPTSIAVQHDGRIVVSGEFDRLFGLARFNSDGSLDTSFFDDGIYSDFVFGGRYGEAWDVFVDRQGRIVASGGSEEGDFAVLRFLPN